MLYLDKRTKDFTMFTMHTTTELKIALKRWKELNPSPLAKEMINVIKAELKLRK